MYNVSIPEISNEELLKRYARIKPIVDINGTKYFLKEFTKEQLTNMAYNWHIDEDKRETVDTSVYVLSSHEDFECIHKYGYHGFFKPSISEVLAQIPEMDVDFVDAFEIIQSPEGWDDFNKNKVVFDNGFHISKVRLYTSKNNPRVIFRD